MFGSFTEPFNYSNLERLTFWTTGYSKPMFSAMRKSMWLLCAVVASGMAVSDPRTARQLSHASLGVSIGGIIVSIFIVIIMFGVVAAGSGH